MKIDLSIVLLFIGHGIRSSAILESSIEFAKKLLWNFLKNSSLFGHYLQFYTIPISVENMSESLK